MIQGRNGDGLAVGWGEVKGCVEEVKMARLETVNVGKERRGLTEGSREF